jgi:hypothetical protein
MSEVNSSGEPKTLVSRYRHLLLKVVSGLVVAVVAILARECAREVGSDLIENRSRSHPQPPVVTTTWAERALMNDTAKVELPCEVVPTDVGGDVPAGMKFFTFGCSDGDLLFSAALLQADSYDLEKGALGALQSMQAEATRSGGTSFAAEQSETSISGFPAKHVRGSFQVGGQVARFEFLVATDGKNGWMIQAIAPDSSGRQDDIKRIFTSLKLEPETAPNTGPPADR